MTMTLADLRKTKVNTETAVEAVTGDDLPEVVVASAELTKLGTDKARTRFNAKAYGDAVTVLVYLPGQLPELLAGESLDLAMGDADSVSTKDGRTKIQWTSSTEEGEVLVLGYLPEDADHVTGISVQFPSGS